jgi:hypothetical protein
MTSPKGNIMAFPYEGNMVFTTVEVFLQDGRLKEYEAAAVAATANRTGHSVGPSEPQGGQPV